MNERWVIARVNRMVYIISIFMGLALGTGYFFNFIRSEVPVGFFRAFAAAVVAQQICNAMIFFRDNGSPTFKYAALIGYAAVYLIAMFGRIDALFGLNVDSIVLHIYVIIIPVMIMYIGYFDLRLIKILAIGAVVSNIAKTAFQISIGYTSTDDIDEYLVPLGCIVITVVSVYVMAKITYENHMKKLKETEDAACRAEAAVKTMQDSINYASKIQRNLLPPGSDMAAVFTDHSVIWKPRDIVGGDVYWMKRFDTGTVLCVADCTGHGTPGALLSMLVTSALESIVWAGTCEDTADNIRRLDKRLSEVLHVGKGYSPSRRGGITDIDDGCDLALLFIATDGTVTFSAGQMPVFVCDGNEVKRCKGQKLFVGEGRIKSRDEVEVYTIPANPRNRIYVASDGLFDQIGGKEGKQFGYEAFAETILKYHHETQEDINARIWDAFVHYMGGEPRRDDFVLVAFKP